MKTKRILSLVLLAALILSLFSGCSDKSGEVIKVAGTAVPAEIYLYYYDKVNSNPEECGLASTASEETKKAKATALCGEYVAVNTMFYSSGLSLNSQDVTVVSEELNSIWRYFSEYYKKLGISKQTLNKIITSEKYSELLFLSLYDKNGTNPVEESRIEEYFVNNYVGFRALSGYYSKIDTSGNSVEMTEEEKSALTHEYSALASQINAGEDFEEVCKKYISAGQSVPVSVLRKDDTGYAEGFFGEVQKAAYGRAFVLKYDRYLFLIVRQNITGEDSEQYAQYRTACLKSLKNLEFNDIVKQEAKGFEYEENEKAISAALRGAGLLAD